jgi:branched-chain amino acid transport system ATP-binding protein
MAPLLELRDVTCAFGGLRALDRVSLDVAEGEILGLIGPNGAGKTTLLNVVAGGAPGVVAGSIRLAGEEVSGMPPQALCRRGVARTFQIPRGFPSLTALDNVRVAAEFGRKGPLPAPAADLARDCLDLVEFPLPPGTRAARCNSAELKRLDLARALASGPKLLLLDEIFSGLTPREVHDLVGVLHAIHGRGITLIVVEHLMRVIMQECRRVVVLCSGEKIAEGTPGEVAADPRVVESYLGAGSGS